MLLKIRGEGGWSGTFGHEREAQLGPLKPLRQSTAVLKSHKQQGRGSLCVFMEIMLEWS